MSYILLILKRMGIDMINLSKQTVDGDVKIERQEIKRDMSFDKHIILAYEISYPQFFAQNYSHILKNINMHYEIQAKKYVMHCEKKLFRMAMDQYGYSMRNRLPVQTFEAQNHFYLKYNKDSKISLYIDRYEYTGGAHGNTQRNADTWNLEKESHNEIISVFPFVRNIKEYIITEITRAADRQIERGLGFYSPEYEEDIRRNFDKNNFYLTDKAIIIFYQEYDIAPYSSGILEFAFPYKKSGTANRPSTANFN